MAVEFIETHGYLLVTFYLLIGYTDVMDSCCLPICPGNLKDDPCAILTEKGVKGIKKSQQERGDDFPVSEGTSVHQNCRKEYCKESSIKKFLKEKASKVPPSSSCVTLRSKQTFDFQTQCLLCAEKVAIDKQDLSKSRKRSSEGCLVKTTDFQTSIGSKCQKRNDEWGNEVMGRIEYARDLHAKDAIYHQQCSVNFRTGKKKPLKFAGVEPPKRAKKDDQLMMFFKVHFFKLHTI